MRLVTWVGSDGQPRAGTVLGEAVIDLAAAAPLVFEDTDQSDWDMLSILQAGPTSAGLDALATIQAAVISQIGTDLHLEHYQGGNGDQNAGMSGNLSIGGAEMLLPLDQVRLLAPLPRPASLRHFDGFEQHALTRYRIARQSLPPVWYTFPGFVFDNPGSVFGPDADIKMPSSGVLDYALELACVIGRAGRDIPVEDAQDYIAGYMIMNGWDSRDDRADAVASGYGLSRARDFATSFGPWLVTPDELEIYADDEGALSLSMLARVNGIEHSRGNSAALFYPFTRMIAYASHDVTLYPGDVLASGPIGGGCLFDLTLGQGPWLQPGGTVELEITGLGVLRNYVVE